MIATSYRMWKRKEIKVSLLCNSQTGKPETGIKLGDPAKDNKTTQFSSQLSTKFCQSIFYCQPSLHAWLHRSFGIPLYSIDCISPHNHNVTIEPSANWQNIWMKKLSQILSRIWNETSMKSGRFPRTVRVLSVHISLHCGLFILNPMNPHPYVGLKSFRQDRDVRLSIPLLHQLLSVTENVSVHGWNGTVSCTKELFFIIYLSCWMFDWWTLLQ